MSADPSFQHYVAQLEAVFDQAVQSTSDDELFASGYLRGHFDLVVAQLELANDAQVEALMPALEAAVTAAKHELSPADQAHIAAFMEKLAAVAV
ncbi:YfcL family protein [Pseudidiomarina taiwanensis]|uniref:YfcL family protein n=1 Tax=Pseudidiomarina taiwanensis TaxID=337250 RepID=A0A432ZJT5_9GAMM|nr:YfcL family protein [Pseudidiomarina taiwanensis]RUO78277.1 hypothetical protein CWI83_04390 [Pseudidiomarina taiwanensis]